MSAIEVHALLSSKPVDLLSAHRRPAMHIGTIQPGDKLVCCKCDHERLVEQRWIADVCLRYFQDRQPPRLHDSDLGKFRCSECKGKSLLKRGQPASSVAINAPARQEEHYQLATAYIDQASAEEQAALFYWANQLMALRVSNLPALEKATRAIKLTIESGAIRPFVTFLGTEIKRVGWDERGLAERMALSSAAAAALVFSGQGAGIAALGGAIGVPLWIVFGAGAAFAGLIIEKVKGKKGIREDGSSPHDLNKDPGGQPPSGGA